jgi:hypothetical protein
LLRLAELPRFVVRSLALLGLADYLSTSKGRVAVNTIRLAPVEAKATVAAVVTLAGSLALLACNPQRQQECEKFVSTMREIDQGSPNAATVDHVSKDIEALQLQDQPLQIFAKNYRDRLSVLSNTLRLNETSSPPDGTDQVIKEQLRGVRTDSQDIQRYCSN